MLKNTNNSSYNDSKTTVVIILEDCKQTGKAYYKCPRCWYCTDKTDRLKRHLIEEHKVKEENILVGNKNNNSSNGNGSNNKVIIDINTVDPEACKVTMNGFEFYRCPVSKCRSFFQSLEGFKEHLLDMHTTATNTAGEGEG
jgi:uncharacterized C2H2 Zn-finger protein